MPYIKKIDRTAFTSGLSLLDVAITNEGELNYVITKLCHNYIQNKGQSYQTLNAVHGVLNCADKELYRQITSKYEDLKIIENGDV